MRREKETKKHRYDASMMLDTRRPVGLSSMCGIDDAVGVFGRVCG
jgi:hypothetical protein